MGLMWEWTVGIELVKDCGMEGGIRFGFSWLARCG